MLLYNTLKTDGIAYYFGRKIRILCTAFLCTFWVFTLLTNSCKAQGFPPVFPGEFEGKCDSDHFHCDNQCFPLPWKCDGEKDCSDGSDEKDCSYVLANQTTCSPNEFVCNGKCAPLSWKCDGEKDCKPDGFDEKGCEPITCPPDKFQCKDRPRCIPTIWLCDGEEECDDGSDEIHCDNHTCASNDFRCANGSKCIKSSWVCDGYNDCGDFYDEKHCNSTRPCLSHEFRCSNGFCVLKKWLCDGENDCGDNSDERANCSQKACNKLTEFSCLNGQCISNLWRCDGSDDCNDGSDEKSCATCSPNTWKCIGSTKCIKLSQVCNGQNDCGDNSDEGPHCLDNDCKQKKCSQLCRQTSTGAKCYCKRGYRIGKDGITCEDINECKNVRQCDHFCFNSIGSYWCKCDQGYVLEEQRRCKLKDPEEPWLIFATQKELRKVTLNGKLYEKVIGNLTKAVALDFDAREGKLYWTDVTDNAIYRMDYVTNSTSSSKPEAIITGLNEPDGLAVDWMGRNLYFSDSSANRICVSKLDGSHKATLISTDLVKPRGLAVDPRDGFLFWTDSKLNNRIERANMDGTNRTVLKDSYVYGVNSLTIDYTLRTIYWIVSHLDFIASMSYYGRNHREIIEWPMVNAQPFAINVFHNNLFFSDWKKRAIVKVSKLNGKRTLLLRSLITPMDIKVYHRSRQPTAFNPCAKNNCGCQHICLISVRQTCTCKCEMGYQLGRDNTSCVKIKEFLLYARRNEICGIPLSVNDNSDVIKPILRIGNAVGLDYDVLEQHIYFTDIIRDNISRISLTGENSETLVKIVRDADGVAVDWVGRNLYWSNFGFPKISVSKLNGSFRKTLFRHDVINPRAIALYPDRGLIFWTDWGIPAKIETANMDGTKRHILVKGGGLQWPNGITVDRWTDEIFWADSKADTIECVFLNGTNRRVLLRQLHHPYGIDVFNGFIYWSDWTTRDIKKVHKDRLHEVTVLKSHLVGVMEIKVYSPIKQLGSSPSPCANGRSGCSHLCLLNPAGFSCHCPFNMTLSNKDNKTCIHSDLPAVYPCPPKSYRCMNNRCIPLKYKCDGENDCMDNSDEDDNANCSTAVITTCQRGLFQCRLSKECISPIMRCDGNYDCSRNNLPDFSDELNCLSQTNCTKDEFKCNNGQCVPDSWVCDGTAQCLDKSDEKDCGDLTCPPLTFDCNDGRCIPRIWRCDGDVDCKDGSDEMNCYSLNCTSSLGQFRCHHGSRCIHRSWICDGDKDCPRGSDEMNCPTLPPDRCDSDELFRCNNSRCIRKKFECDRQDDCGDNSDEHSSCNATICSVNEFSCANRQCIPVNWACDGAVDCADGSDETKCGSPPPTTRPRCPSDKWRCHDGITCIRKSQVCDDKVDCPDTSDEGPGCGISGCHEKNGGCSQGCMNIPGGVQCFCYTGFKLAADNTTCLDVDECKFVSTCSQRCYNLKGSFACRCVKGYQLMNDRRGCKATGDIVPYLYFSTRNAIQKIDIPLGLTTTVYIRDLISAIGIDFDWNEQRLYWADLSRRTISRSFLNGTGQEDLITEGLHTVEGVAVDWIGRHLYWSDMTADRIEVATLDGKWRNILVSDDLKKPRGLVVDPRDGYLFWTDWGSSRVERSSLDGTNRVQLVSKNIRWPNGLTLDFANRRVYWIDAAHLVLEFCNYDGSNRQVVVNYHNINQHPFALTMFEDSLYWTDWKKNVWRAHKMDGGGLKSLFTGLLKPMDIHVVHPLRQPEGINYCANSSCSHLCLLVPNGYTCRCPIGMALLADKTNCGDDFSTLLVATNQGEVRGISLDPNNTVDTIISTFQLSHAVAVDFDYELGLVYWSDIREGTISRVFINGSSKETIIRDVGSPKPEGIAVDWIAKNIYWTDVNRKLIGVARADGSFPIILIKKSISKPRDIVVHPVKGLLYWSDWDKSSPRIEQSSLDGSARRVFVKKGLGYINGLTIDYSQSQLYWCDAGKDSIERIGLDGTGRRKLYRDKDMLRHTFGISLFENTLYWSDWIKKGIFSGSKFGGRKEDIQVHREGLQYVYCVEVYSRRRQTGTNLCKQDNGGCEQLCLMKNSNSRRCACSMGFSLGKDQKSCNAINTFLLYATSKAIYGTSIDFKDSTSAMNPIAGMSNINSIDFFYNSSWIFYSDDRKRNIGRVNRDGTRKMIIISTGLRRPQGIAVDWVGMNLYWTDSGTDLIEVSRLNGSSRHVIISSGLSEPRSIVVHPGRGLLYWSDWSPPRIERSSMDGSFRQVLVWGSKIRRPSGLTIDYDQDIVYWVDLRRDSIWKMDLNGGNQKKLVSRLKQPLGLSVFGELLYWADRNKNIIQSAYKTNGTNIKQKTLLTKPRDVQVFSSERQSTGGVCEANGGCADLCLAISSKRKRCACSLGSLSSDKRSCLSTSNFIILAKTTEIKFNSLVPGKTSSQKEITDVTPVMRRQLDFDFDSETIFFTSPPAIKAVKIDGSGLRNVTLDVINPGGIAVDWVAKHVYWTEIAFSTINRVHFNGSSFKVALKQGINHPRALAIIPCEKKIYWIEWGRRPCIKSAWFNGMFVSDLITGSLVYPYGLTIDYMEEKIYWTDERIIQSAYLNGTNRQTITSSIRPALALTVFGEFIYWIDWHSTVMRANKYNGGNPVRMSYEVASGLPLDINVYAKERQDCTQNPCALNGGCTQVCSAKNGLPVCSCRSGYMLVQGYRCINPNTSCQSSYFTCTNGKCVPQLAVCDSIDDCGDGSDELPLVCANRKCSVDQFKCNHGHCIDKKWRCDTEVDCRDGSDEQGCPPKTCAPGKFQCANGQCINTQWKCDYRDDCGDGSDEVGCPTRQCAGNEFRCNNGLCKLYEDMCDGNNDCGDFSDEQGCKDVVCPTDRIKCNTTSICVDKSWLCDGHNDCGDNWDERPAVCSLNKCAPNEFQCTGSNRCIPRHWLCDGESDCSDDSDEPSSCQTEQRTCAANYFTCKNGNCISQQFVCDGDDDCGDSSDETSSCPKRNCTGLEFKCVKSSRCIPLAYMCDGDNDCGDGSDEASSLNCMRRTCSSSQFRCLNGLCIDKKWRCDYEDDCGDNSDEMSCANHTCSHEQFQCSSGHCVSRDLTCDHVLNCRDGSDEDPSLCASTPTPLCPSGTFKCANKKCIANNLVCNNIDDCSDMSDERHCNINECLVTNYKVCSHICTDTPTSYKCSCRTGFKLMSDGKSCKDIDECSSYSLNNCRQLCVNFPGSFKCTCAPGYELESTNRRECKATGKVAKPYLIFSERNQIRSMDINGWYKDIVLNNVHPWALDFDYEDHRLYWTQVGTVPRVLRAYLNGTGSEVIVKTGLKWPETIAVDWVGRNLYISDLVLNKIFVTTLSGRYMKTLLTQVKAKALVVYPTEGFLFYTNWAGRRYIGRCGLDGSSPLPLIQAKMLMPSGLTLCHLSKKLFWVDSVLDRLEYSNLDGSLRTQLTSFKVKNPFSIVVYEDNIYWSDARLATIMRSFKWTGTGHQILHKSTSKLYDIQIIHPSLQPRLDNPPCSKLACTGLCLLTPNGGAKCACSDNMYLANDGRTCFENCTNNEMACDNYRCIPRLWWCDGVIDCTDSSDEKSQCPQRHCPPGTHQCLDGKTCVSPFQICDGKNNCPKGGDEYACSARQCTSYQFECSNHICIFKSQVCDGVHDCQDGSDEHYCPTAVPCTSNQYKCPSGRCIDKRQLCDGNNDCGDNIDEALDHCPKSCPKESFKCKTKFQCIPQTWTCDGSYDCRDKSDEDKSLCSRDHCLAGMFHCQNKKCVPMVFRCDQDDDCGDGSDESLCKTHSCLPHHFRCKNGHCIDKDWVCNGQNECGDNSDEKDCGVISCREGQIKCRNGDCIEKGWKCDGERDCQDASDEKGCPSRYPHGRVCPQSQFQCVNNVCISRTWMCDGEDDCGDFSDEYKRLCEYHKCSPKTQFRCHDFHCIPKWKVCDGVNDCGKNEDETDDLCHKPIVPRCSKNQFKCQNHKCIDGDMVCNRQDNCGDASDELLCPINKNLSCEVNNGGCSQQCRLLGSNVVCSCWSGFEFDASNRKCVDVNECLLSNVCEQQCINTVGSYKCRCTDGYSPSPDNKHRCKPMGGPSVLLFPSGSQIRRFVVAPRGTNDYDEGVSNLESVGALDVLVTEGLLFWTDLKNKTIRRAKIPEGARHRARRSTSPTIQDLSLPLGVANGIAVDWIGRNIFWTDSIQRVIKVARTDGRYRRTVVSAGLADPGDIIVDSNRGLLFWADRGPEPKIESSNMDGTNRTPLVTTKLIWPSGLCLDQTTRQLYWSDYKAGRVERIGLDGHGRAMVLNGIQKPSSISVSGYYLYITTNNQIVQVDKFGYNKSVTLLDGLQRVSSLRVQQKEHQVTSPGAPCAKNNGNCTYLCLTTSTGYVCACPDGDVNSTEPCSSGVVKPLSPPACSLVACGYGTCLEADGKAICICPSGFTGPYCTTPLSSPSPSPRSHPCLTLSCYNGGICSVKDGRPHCRCPQGTAGISCEESCSTFQCGKGGRCETSDNTIYCRCKSGYRYTTGPGCDHDPCVNFTKCGQNGQCYVNGSSNKPYCRCADESIAVSCGSPSVLGQNDTPDNVLPKILIPVVMTLLVALTVTLLLCCRQRGTAKPHQYCGMNIRVGNPSFMYEEMPDDNISIVSREYTRTTEQDKGTNFSNPVYDSILHHNISSSTALLADHEFISDFSWHNVDFINPMYEALYEQGHSHDVLFRGDSTPNMNGNASLNRESYA